MSIANKNLCAYHLLRNTWTIEMVAAACAKGKITPEEFKEITGEPYSNYATAQ